MSGKVMLADTARTAQSLGLSLPAGSCLGLMRCQHATLVHWSGLPFTQEKAGHCPALWVQIIASDELGELLFDRLFPRIGIPAARALIAAIDERAVFIDQEKPHWR